MDNWWPVIAVLVGVGVAVAVLTVVLKRRRGQTWHQLARNRGLHFEEGADGPRVFGEQDDRSVDVRVASASSDRELGGVEVLRMAVALSDVPRGMTAEGEPGLIGDLVLASEERITFPSAPDFDRNVLVKGDNEAAIRAWWTVERRKTFTRLAESAPCDSVLIEDGQLIAQLREVVSDLDRLNGLLDQLLSAAAMLDAE